MDPIALEEALEKKCKSISWLVWILFLASTPSIFNASHLTSYVFLGGDPPYWCKIPELVEANWTKEQIREVSTPGIEKHSCVHYAWNYTLLRELGFGRALNYSNITPKPDVVKCRSYLYEEEVANQTVVSQWDLVCDDFPLRSTAQDSVAMGKFFGAMVFGLCSDRFGRKKTFIFSSILFMVSAPSAALVNSYVMFIVFRTLTGVASAGIFESSYTILLELTVKHYRVCLGNMYQVSYSFGLIFLPLAAYLTNTWRHLQLAISVPLFVLFFHCWFLPESPRWLVTKGKLDKAKNIIGSIGLVDASEPHQPPRSDIKDRSYACCWKVLLFFKNYLKIISTLELAKRTFICNYLWCFGYLSYFLIAMNGSNFDVDQRLYIGLTGIVDIPGVLLPILILMYFGRKKSAIAFYSISGIIMIVLTIIPQGWPVMCVALVGRILGTAALRIVTFYTLELFPTETRNTALGSCLTISQIGPWLAPYLVQNLGKKLWWIPTVLCGSLALFGALLLMFLPETRNTPMLDTIKEMKNGEKKHLNEYNERSS